MRYSKTLRLKRDNATKRWNDEHQIFSKNLLYEYCENIHLVISTSNLAPFLYTTLTDEGISERILRKTNELHIIQLHISQVL